MPIIGLLAVGVSLAIDKYQERQAARNAGIDSHGQNSGFETGITSPEIERRREEEAFHELQNYADFQNALSSKVLDELSKDDSLPAPYSSNLTAITNRSGSGRYNQSDGVRHTTQGRLPCLIIISQNAPGPDGPGWVRTYSPVLMDCGISQESFLKFLDSFNESLQFYPDIEAVNVTALQSGVGWRDKTTELSTAIPSAVRLAKDAQRYRELDTFLDQSNLSLFTPRGLFAMVITSNPNDLSPVLTINVLDSSHPGRSELNMQDLTFGGMDYGHTTFNLNKTKQPQPRRSNKLQKMSNFISDYSDRRAHIQPTSPSNNLPLFSLISSISSNRESKNDSRKRQNHRFQRARPTSKSSGVSSVEGAFGVTKVGKSPASAKGIMERMRRDEGDEGDAGQERDVWDAKIQTGVLYLVIVNDPGNEQKFADHGEVYDEPAVDIDPSIAKGKEREENRYEEHNGVGDLIGRKTVDEQHFDDEHMDAEDLPPRYSTIHPQHQARVQAWREQNPESYDPVL